MNCGIFDSEPDGRDAGERRAARGDQRQHEDQRDRERAEHPAHAEPGVRIQTPTAPMIGTPIHETSSGSSMSPQHVVCPRWRCLRRRRPRNALDEHLRPREERDQRRDDHHRDAPPERPGVEDVRPAEERVPSAIEPARGWISPSEIMIGTTTTKLSSAPSSRLDASADAHEAAGADHREVERRRQRELADVHARELRQRRDALVRPARSTSRRG